MKPYNSEPHVPTWISALDGELLSSAELRVLDFIHWCKKHGCRTSNDRIGSYTHHSHKTVERAIQKLYQLDLIAIYNFGKRTRRLNAVPWADREQWEMYQKLKAKSETDAGQNDPHITSSSGLPTVILAGEVCSESPTAGDDILSRDVPSRALPRGSVGGGSSEISTTPAKPESKTTSKPKKPMSLYQMKALEHRDKIEFAGRTRAQANQLTLVKYPNADFEE